MFGISTAASLALATVQPLLANYLGLLLPVLLGLGAAVRWSNASLIVGGFFAMAGGIGSQLAFDRYLELSRGSVATLGSIAEVPRHPEATRFVVEDVRADRSLAGSIARTTTRGPGAGPNPQRRVLHVMPLVPQNWKRSEPVPAWIACTATPGFDCLTDSARGIHHTIRVRNDDLVAYRPAVADAEGRHRLTSAAGAPLLEASADAAGAETRFLSGSILWPLAAYVAWMLTLIGWRWWRTRS